MQMEIEGVDPQAADDDAHYHIIDSFYDVTPHGMLLVSLGACTCIMLHSYAQNHNIELEEVEVRMQYFHEPEDHIEATVGLTGEFDEKTYARLIQVSPHCTVHHALDKGIAIDWAEADEEAS
jgi:uncharacterized OsmC-like protein